MAFFKVPKFSKIACRVFKTGGVVLSDDVTRDFHPLPPLATGVELVVYNAPHLIMPPLFSFAVVFHDNQLIVPVLDEFNDVILVAV